MKAAILAVALFAASAYAQDFNDYALDQSEARFLYMNSSSSASTITLLGAVILLGVIGYLVYTGGFLGSSQYNRNDYYQQDQQYYDPSQYAQQYR